MPAADSQQLTAISYQVSLLSGGTPVGEAGECDSLIDRSRRTSPDRSGEK